MKTLRIASYNIEWMNNLFVSGKAMLRTQKRTGMGRNPIDTTLVCNRIASVIKDLKADIIGVQEGPAKLTQMQFFVKEFLADEYSVYGVESGAQSIYALVRKGLDVDVKQIPASHRFYKHLKNPVVFQPWGEYKSAKSYSMARPPVLLQVHKKGSTSDVVNIIVAHTKSQFTRGFTKAKFESRDPKAMKEAVLSRQKLSADVAAYRRHVTHAILSKSAGAVILMGDLNDGFTRSVFEKEFLMQSLVDELRGSFRRESSTLNHTFTEKQLSEKEAHTVEFRDATNSNRVVHELIDHILITPKLQTRSFWLQHKAPSSRIAHAISAKYTENKGKAADDRPSDHIPVFTDFKF